MTSATRLSPGPGRRRLRLSTLLVVSLGVLVVIPQAPGTFALLTATLRNPSARFATSSLYAPTALTATAVGHDVALGWTAGQNGSGYAVGSVANGASSNCTGASYATIGTPSGTSYTDTGRFAPQGSWWCYRATTTYGAWTSVAANPTVAARIGFFTDTASLSNGGGFVALADGDRIVVTFNQPVDTSTGPMASDTVCATAGGPIYLGSATTSGACGAGEVLSVGTLTGSTVLSNGRWDATFTWSNANKTLTVELDNRIHGSVLALTTLGLLPSWVFNPTTRATKLLSATGAEHVCDSNAGGGTCLPAPTGTLA